MRKTIKSRRDFERVFSRGRRLNDALVRMRVLARDDEVAGRVAFVAGKRLGNAVYRNRCKRVLREAAREVGLPQDGYDVVLLATERTHDSSPERVGAAMRGLVRRAGIR